MNIPFDVLLPFLSAIGGALIVGVPVWRKIGAEKKKIEAETESISVSTLIDTLNEMKSRVSGLETNFQKKIDEVKMLTDLLAEKDRKIKTLEGQVETLKAVIRSLVGTPKNKKEQEALHLLDEMEETK